MLLSQILVIRDRPRLYGENLSLVKESPSYPSCSGEPTFPEFPYKTWRTVYMRNNFHFPLSWTDFLFIYFLIISNLLKKICFRNLAYLLLFWCLTKISEMFRKTPVRDVNERCKRCLRCVYGYQKCISQPFSFNSFLVRAVISMHRLTRIVDLSELYWGWIRCGSHYRETQVYYFNFRYQRFTGSNWMRCSWFRLLQMQTLPTILQWKKWTAWLITVGLSLQSMRKKSNLAATLSASL